MPKDSCYHSVKARYAVFHVKNIGTLKKWVKN
jgi:hypothetical protein